MTAVLESDVAAPDYRRAAWATGVGLLIVAVVWHRVAGYSFPRPWPDESHFIAPAWALAHAGRLSVPELNAPSGIFWMPTGYYLLQLPLLLGRLDPLGAARLLSAVGVGGFAAAVAAVGRRAGVHPAWAAGGALVWLCMPRTVAMGNIARMEGPILGLTGLALWLVSRDRWPAAVAVAWVTPLIHPIGLVVAVALTVTAIVRGHVGSWSPWERLLLLAVAVAWGLELWYFVLHADVAEAHLRFQLGRKAGRPIEFAGWQYGLLAATAAAGLAATIRWWHASSQLQAVWAAIAVAGGFVLVDVVGREMWYWGMGRETVAFLLLMAFAVAVARLRPVAVGAPTVVIVGAIVLGLGAGVAARQTMLDGWFNMRPSLASTQEWRSFVQQSLTELNRLDDEPGPPATVVVDPLSGFGQELYARQWQRLRFVQPTPATPLDATDAKYVLATPGAPFVTASLIEQWGQIAPVVDLRSSAGAFGLQLYANPDRS